MMAILIFALFITGALHGSGNDWLVVPGVRAGPITPATTRPDLIRMFGGKNVVDDDVTVSDAGPEPGTILFRERPEDSITILWDKDNSGKQIDLLVFCISQLPNAQVQKTCHWRTRSRISFGTTLKQLEKTNGKSFHLLGFAWDYAEPSPPGTVALLEKSLRRDNCGGLGLRVDPDFGDKPSHAQIALMDQVTGDRSFSSTNPTMQTLKPRVDWMTMGFGNCAPPAK